MSENQTNLVIEGSGDGLEAIWWRQVEGLRCGRMEGETRTGGWKWEVSSADTVWLWLNRQGEGLVWGETERFFLKPGMFAMTGGEQKGSWTCVRQPGRHVLDVVVISRDWLFQRLGGEMGTLHSDLEKWLRSGRRVAFCGLMGVWERDLCAALARAGRNAGAASLLAEAKVIEWMATRLFKPESGRGASGFHEGNAHRDPVRHAVQLLRERLDQPLDLAALAREVGVAPHHLSRRVGVETGSTLQRHLRRLRIEHACQCLDSKRMNVTEVALEVGYQSLSHFAKAFREETGRSPSDWLAGRSGQSEPGGG